MTGEVAVLTEDAWDQAACAYSDYQERRAR